jgi:tetratricopeptide (TPR) repeat protein
MDAQTLFREGITAVREEKNLAKGRDLLSQSLRLNATNDMAWLWLARTITDRAKQIQCIERALKINPDNQQAKTWLERLSNPAATTAAPVSNPKKVTTTTTTAITENAQKATIGAVAVIAATTNSPAIQNYLTKAKTLLEQNDPEGAIEQWVGVLEIQPDHEEALANAVRYLSRLKYMDDARELVWNALNKGTTHPSVYLTAIDIAKYQKNFSEADDLRLKLASLPAADENLVVSIVDHFLHNSQEAQALEVLQNAVESHPKSQRLLIRLADLTKEQGRTQDSFELYDRAARLGSNTKEGKDADEKLLEFAPSLTDQERGSVLLAVREAAGFGVVFLLMAWQDAGLNLLHLGINRLVGIIISILGGYLLITATSSPAQQPLARWLGGVVPEPPEKPLNDFEAASIAPQSVSNIPAITFPTRLALGAAGSILIVLAFWLVFSTAIGLLNNPNPKPYYLPTCAETFLNYFEVEGIC